MRHHRDVLGVAAIALAACEAPTTPPVQPLEPTATAAVATPLAQRRQWLPAGTRIAGRLHHGVTGAV